MLYGTTTQYGTNGYGTAFKLDTNGNNFTVIHTFGAGTDGEEPQAALVQGKDGFLYGTTLYGGTNQQGMVFKVSTDGSVYADLFDFSAYAPDTGGSSPDAPLVQGNDGALYGTASNGGGDGYGAGTVFKLNTDGSGFTVLYTFLISPYANGYGPEAALTAREERHFLRDDAYWRRFGFWNNFCLARQSATEALHQPICPNRDGVLASRVGLDLATKQQSDHARRVVGQQRRDDRQRHELSEHHTAYR